MIRRRRRLERVRTRQHDEARAASVRAEVAAAAAVVATRDAEQRWLATALGGPTIAELEQSMDDLGAAIDQQSAAEAGVAAAQTRAQGTARAWQRADVALTRALERRQLLLRKQEAREHDEAAARRKA